MMNLCLKNIMGRIICKCWFSNLICLLAVFTSVVDVKSLRAEISSLRRQILSALEQVMLGDSLAAEYFLCHLISSV